WMGIKQDFQDVDAHVHWNLLGFAASTLYGLIHKTHPAMARSRLAWPQFWLHVLGVVVFVAGIFVVLASKQEALVIAGSLMLIVAALTFLGMFLTAKAEAA
ncbi:MAG TPA: hypothetical protein VGG68_12075, partial [Caulobacteraceae bacterium]